jgi:hypothetical protein
MFDTANGCKKSDLKKGWDAGKGRVLPPMANADPITQRTTNSIVS